MNAGKLGAEGTEVVRITRDDDRRSMLRGSGRYERVDGRVRAST